ncbi:MAG: hypothetical protein WCK70_16160 [Chloroflexales bacterium]
MTTMTIEERVALLEHELLQLKHRLPGAPAAPWWEHITGVFAATPAFESAVDLGRQYRESQRPDSGEDADVPA